MLEMEGIWQALGVKLSFNWEGQLSKPYSRFLKVDHTSLAQGHYFALGKELFPYFFGVALCQLPKLSIILIYFINSISLSCVHSVN